MRALLALMRENVAAVQEMLGICQHLLSEACAHLTVPETPSPKPQAETPSPKSQARNPKPETPNS